MAYQLTETSSILRIADGAIIPADPANSDYSEYLAWVELGNSASPIPLPSLSMAKIDQIASISAACKSYIYSGFTSLALGASYHYPANDKDQTNLAGSVIASLYPNLPIDWTTPFWCEDSAGIWDLRAHTAAQIQQVGSDAKAMILAALTKNKTLQGEIAAATTVSAVQAIVW